MKFLRNVLAVVGLLAIVIGAVGCKVLVDYLRDVNQVPNLINTTAATLEAINSSTYNPVQATRPAVINFAVVDGDSEPEVQNLVPVLPETAVSPQPDYEAVIDYAEVLAEPAATRRPLSDEQLLACLSAQQEGRRMAPYCPTNAAQLLGEGR